MSFHEPYFDIKAISNSALGNIDKSYSYWEYRENTPIDRENFDKDNPNNPTVATLLGSAFHELVLEPKKFKREESETKTICAKYMREDFEKGAEKLLFGQMEKVKKMEKVLREHPVGKDIFSRAKKEQSIFFYYKGVKCKSKIDWVNKKRKLIRDLKTIDKLENIDRAIFKYGYFRQATFYQLACYYEYGEFFDFEFVFVSKDFVDVKVVKMGDDWFRLGMREVDRLLDVYKSFESGYETFKGAYGKVETSNPKEWQINLTGGELE